MPLRLIKYGLPGGHRPPRHIPAPTELKPSYDVVIIGGGGHGLAAAYYLAREHGITNVAVLEKGYLAGGNTARNTAVVRANYVTPGSVRFYAASVKLYETLGEDLDFNIMFSQRGQLTLAHTDSSLRLFRLRAETNRHVGVHSEIIGVDEIRRLVPTLNLEPTPRYPVLAGLWHPPGGMARHDAVAWGFARRATERGAEIHQHTAVTGVDVENGRVVGVRTTRGRTACGAVIQAVAGSSSIVAAMAGLRLPIVTYPLQAMVTMPLKPFLDPLVSSAQLHCYVSQTPRGEVVIGGGSDPYPLYSTRSTLDLKEGLIQHAIEMFPCLAEVPLLRQWAGITDMTPDYSPIMGRTAVEKYYIDAGWGTWGFKATPICGRMMAALAATGRVPDLIADFALDRFRTLRLVNEMGATAASH
ncbi:MAG: FAD-dependent oxidoreductase [Alphaproteobacteria bacterium]|nr:FAD-dependent oxidoreductase [Alphaproteobacteria bacterium]